MTRDTTLRGRRVGEVDLRDLGDLARWIGATDTERGEALRDLLGLADHLPPPRRRAPMQPRLVPA